MTVIVPSVEAIAWQSRQQSSLCRRHWPGDGGRERLSLSPFSALWNPQGPQSTWDTSPLPHSNLLTCAINLLFMFQDNVASSKHWLTSSLFSQIWAAAQTHYRLDAPSSPSSAEEPSFMTSVLVVIKIKHFLEPLLPKMLMQFTFFNCDRQLEEKCP